MDCPDDEEPSPESLSLSDSHGEGELEEQEEQERQSAVGREEGERLPNRRSPYSLGEVLAPSLFSGKYLNIHLDSCSYTLLPPPFIPYLPRTP